MTIVILFITTIRAFTCAILKQKRQPNFIYLPFMKFSSLKPRPTIVFFITAIYKSMPMFGCWTPRPINNLRELVLNNEQEKVVHSKVLEVNPLLSHSALEASKFALFSSKAAGG